MERLTRKMCGGWGVIPGYELSTVKGMKAVVDRLAAYEDKGVAPEDTLTAKEMAEVACALNELKAYKDTERTPEEVKSMSHLFDYVVAESKTMPETVKFFQRLRELAQAEKDGRVFVLPKTRARWIKDIIDERERQDQKWGFPQKNTYCEWSSILAEETGELAKELNELSFRSSLIQNSFSIILSIASTTPKAIFTPSYWLIIAIYAHTWTHTAITTIKT